MKNLSTVLLRIVIALGGLFVLAFLVFAGPEFNEELIANTQDWFHLSVISVIYAAVIPFYFVLYQSFRLLGYIDADKTFSLPTIRALMWIKRSAILMSGLYALLLPLFYMLAQEADAPGVLVFAIILTGTALAAASFAAVLQQVVQKAIADKR